MVIKLNEWEPDTCAAGEPPCRISQRHDTDQPLADPVIVGYFRVCSAHAGEAYPVGKLLWADGNWKDLVAYYDYQKNWFKWRAREAWQVRRVSEPEIGEPPPGVRGHKVEPPTPGSVATPSAGELSGKATMDGWLAEHNARKNQSKSMLEVEIPELAPTDWEEWWRFEGTGDGRILYINTGGQLTPPQRTAVQAAADIQFGPGKVVIEG